MLNQKNKTINNLNKLKEFLNLELKEEEQKYLNMFFKKRFIIFENNKIKYPLKENIKLKINDIKNEINKLTELKKYWTKKKKTAENYYQRIYFTKYFKKDYWRHKIKEITNKEYKEDLKNIDLSEEILMDPEYKHLLNAFLLDPDYRKKLTETVNKSIVYRNSKIGNISKKKQDFKIDVAIKKSDQINIKIKDNKQELKIYKIILKIIRFQNKTI
jgi:hypothetical protein